MAQTLEIVKVEGVRGFVDENGTVQLNAEDVARGLGFVQIKNGVEYVRWETVNKYLNDFGYDSFSQLVGKESFIPENMFYRLAMKASNAAAQAFQSKIADVILPAIRKHGFYATESKIEEIVRNPEQFIEYLITAYQRVKTERDELQTTVNALKPKADYCEKILQSPEALNVTVIAKDYGMSAVMFNQLLYSLKIQYLSNKTWVLYQEHVGKGYTVFETFLPQKGYAKTQMRWTQKGRMFLYHTLKKHGTVPLIEREEPMEKLFGGVA